MDKRKIRQNQFILRNFELMLELCYVNPKFISFLLNNILF